MTDTVSPEMVALVRRRYIEGAAIKSIRAETGVENLATIYRCLDGELDDGSGAPPQPIPRRVARGRFSRAALVARLWRNADRQVRQIEKQIDLAPDEPNERNARMSAVLVRTVRELTAIDARNEDGATPAAAQDDDDSVPRDIDQFRNELARRIRAFVETRTGGGVSRDGAAENDRGDRS